MRGVKKKKPGDRWDSGQISFEADADFSVSLGELFGKPGQAAHVENAEKDAKREKHPKNEIELPEGFLASVTQATLHRESSGRGGRTVVAVSIKPEPDARTAEALAKAMRKGLGCGTHAEGQKVILQGDIQERAADWLMKRGVGRTVMGN